MLNFFVKNVENIWIVLQLFSTFAKIFNITQNAKIGKNYKNVKNNNFRSYDKSN